MNSIKLMNHIFIRVLKLTGLVFTLFVVLEVILFGNTSKSLDFGYTRFEQALDKSGIGLVFWASFVIILIITFVILMSYYWGSKSIYSILSLPVTPGGTILSFIIPCIINLLILCTLQLVLLILFGLWLPSFFPNREYQYMNNYILLGVIRFTPTSFLFPLSILQWGEFLLILISPAVVLVYSFFMTMVRKFYVFMIDGLWIFFIYNLTRKYVSMTNMIINLAAILLLTVYMYWRVVKNVKGRCIG